VETQVCAVPEEPDRSRLLWRHNGGDWTCAQSGGREIVVVCPDFMWDRYMNGWNERYPTAIGNIMSWSTMEDDMSYVDWDSDRGSSKIIVS
jgi:hypothetical protein